MIRVVLCDDHGVVLAGLERLLATFDGIEVVATAADGDAALAAVAVHRPDVVLMDLQMPKLDGVEATKRIMADAPSTRVVIFTSFSDRPRIKAALAAGAIGYQLKDATPENRQDELFCTHYLPRRLPAMHRASTGAPRCSTCSRSASQP